MTLDKLIRETFSLESNVEIAEEFGPSALPGWDSMGHMRLMAAIESNYGIKLSMDDILKIEKVADIRNILTTKGVTGL